jgi:GntR family transcriptional regulator / MocR family aminotransferase
MEPILEFELCLPPKPSRVLLRALHRQLRDAILDGRLRPGLRLPPTRTLAGSLGISRNTVIAAYDLLLSEGYIAGRRGAGTFVADLHPILARPTPPSGTPGMDRRIVPYWRGYKQARIVQTDATWRYDFQIGFPDVTHFPFDIWQRLATRAARALSKHKLTEVDAEGRPALREAIAKHVSFARAVSCQPDDIVVVSGTRNALDLLARILVTPGETDVAVEDPVFTPVRDAFAAAGARLLAIPVDREGLIVEQIPASARVVFVSPSHQFPLGVTMSARRRKALLDFAQSVGAVVIEDDYDGEFRLDGRPLEALQTLDRAQSVFYVGTFSKSLFPGLRLGFVAAPAWARPALVAAKHVTDGYGPVLSQDALASFIAEGHLARHVRKMRKVYGERQLVLRQALQEHCAGRLRPIPASAGVHMAAELIGRGSGSDIAAAASARGIRISSLDRYGHRDGAPTGLAFGYGLIDTNDIEPAIRSLARVME